MVKILAIPITIFIFMACLYVPLSHMELVYCHQVGFEQLKNTRFDYFIAASGYEERSTYLIDNIEVKADNKIVLSFEDKKDLLFREKNDKCFEDKGFTFIEESAGQTDRINILLADICNNSLRCENISILVDYSCMTKTWYAGILKYMTSHELNIDSLELYFSYTSAVFTEPLRKEIKVLSTSPRGLLKANVRPSKPRALILGLGYEKLLTPHLIKNFESMTVFAFYTDPAYDNRYTERVMKNNRKILRSLPKDHICKYPIEDLKKTDALLTALSIKLRLNYHVAILPVGPKPFTLSSLLLASRYPDIEVWSLDRRQSSESYSRTPLGEPLVCKILLSGDEEKYL